MSKARGLKIRTIRFTKPAWCCNAKRLNFVYKNEYNFSVLSVQSSALNLSSNLRIVVKKLSRSYFFVCFFVSRLPWNQLKKKCTTRLIHCTNLFFAMASQQDIKSWITKKNLKIATWSYQINNVTNLVWCGSKWKKRKTIQKLAISFRFSIIYHVSSIVLNAIFLL